MSDTYECHKCGEEFQKPVDLSMHYRVIHTGALDMGISRSDE